MFIMFLLILILGVLINSNIILLQVHLSLTKTEHGTGIITLHKSNNAIVIRDLLPYNIIGICN